MSFSDEKFYVTGGTLQGDAICYVERLADKELLASLKDGKFCYILTSRQMGKSSLMVRTAKQLRKEGFAVVVLDLTAVGQNLTPEQWYDGLLNYVGQQLSLEDEIEDCWFDNKRLSPLLRWLKVIREVVLKKISKRIIIFVDEIDTIRSLAFSMDEFFAAIRELYNDRTQNPDLERLTFCLLGVATPSDLIRDTRTTPFNIGQRIELKDFTETEALGLAQGLKRENALGLLLLKRIVYWTGGHPFLTQRLCESIAENASINNVEDIDKVCEDLFFSNRAKEKDDNLLFVRERLLRSEVDLAGLLELYRHIHRGKKIEDDETNQLISTLRLSGIAKFEKGQLRVRNRIYEKVFDQRWITKNMPDAEVRRQLVARRKGQLQASIVASIIISIMGLLTLFAIKQRIFAQEQETINRRQLYISQIELAYQALEDKDRGRAKQLLRTVIPDPNKEDLRNFEWNYLSHLSNLEIDTFKTDPAWTTSITFFSDSKILVSADSSGFIKFWNVEEKKEVTSIRGHSSKITSITISPSGKILASAGIDGTVKLWDVVNKEEITTLKGHRKWVNSVAFSPDSKILAGAVEDGTVKLWDVVNKKEITTLKGHRKWVNSVAFSPDGKLLVTGSSDNTAKIWDVVNKEEITTLKGHRKWVNSVAFSPDGKLLVTASSDNSVKLWNAANFTEINHFIGHSEDVYSAAFSPDNRLLATISSDNTIKIWEIESCKEINSIKGHTKPIYSLAFSPNGKMLVTASIDKTIKFWDTSSAEQASILRGHYREINSVSFFPNGKFLATISDDTFVKLWDSRTKEQVATLSGHLNSVRSLAISSDNRLLVTGSLDKTVKVWDLEAKKELVTFNGHTSDINSVAISQDCKIIASASSDKTVKIWDLETKRELTTLKGHTNQVTTVAFSLKGDILASGGKDKSIKLWNLSTMKEIYTLTKHDQPIISLFFSPDDKHLVSLSKEEKATEVKLWNLSTKEQEEHIVEQDINCVTFSPDGKRLIAGKTDGSIKLWDWDKEKLQEIGSFKIDEKEIASMAFSSTGKSLALVIRGERVVKLVNTVIDEKDRTPLLVHSNQFIPFNPVNLDFEEAIIGQCPAGWFVARAVRDLYLCEVTKDRVKEGRLATLLARKIEGGNSESFGPFLQVFDGKPYRNKKVKFRTALQVDDPSTKVQMWIKTENKDLMAVGFFNSGNISFPSNQWVYNEVEVDVNEDTEKIYIGISLLSNGKLWIDDASFAQADYIEQYTDKDKAFISSNPLETNEIDEIDLGEFVEIKAGEFLMGGNEEDNRPTHKVIISKNFEIGKYEVTQEEWERLMGHNPSNFRGIRLPVENVSWNDVKIFIEILNSKSSKYIYRLPSEAEWEYVARAGIKGENLENIDDIAWYSLNSQLKTHPIGGKQANRWGVYDLYGNVMEWCEDWKGDYLSGTVKDPKGESSGSLRIFRGGCWATVLANFSPSFRFYNAPVAQDNLVGFRLVREKK
jgi:WD40 repeat protein/formylglycine-generating enzyme required for sulfatase activity